MLWGERRHRALLGRTCFAFILLPTFSSHCQKAVDPSSQFVGKYSQKSSGADAMSATHLIIMADGNYAVLFFGGGLQGTWKVLPDGGIELREWKDETPAFLLYGRNAPGRASTTRIAFEDITDGSVRVGFADASGGRLRMKPAFNDDSNCYEPEYAVSRPSRDLPVLLAAALPDARSDPREVAPADPSSTAVFRFDLAHTEYNDFRMVYNQASFHTSIVSTGHLVSGKLVLSGIGGKGDSNFGASRAISEGDLKEVPEFIAQQRSSVPENAEFKTRKGNTEETNLYKRVPSTTTPFDPSSIVLDAPLFFARCQG